MKMQLNNIFENKNININKEVIESIVNSSGIRIEKIVSSGQKSPDGFWYNQKENEFVLLLQGEAVLEFDNKNIVHLEKGDYIIIEKFRKHRITYTATDVLTVWLAVFYK